VRAIFETFENRKIEPGQRFRLSLDAQVFLDFWCFICSFSTSFQVYFHDLKILNPRRAHLVKMRPQMAALAADFKMFVGSFVFCAVLVFMMRYCI
jgi:hypothetical protein